MAMLSTKAPGRFMRCACAARLIECNFENYRVVMTCLTVYRVSHARKEGAKMGSLIYDPQPAEVLTTVQRYRDLGLSILPIRDDGSKMPDGRALPLVFDEMAQEERPSWKPFQANPATDEQVNQWFGGNVRRGIAIICGKVSGNLEVLDGDALDVFPEYIELVKTHDPALYERLAIIETPGDGRHLPWRCEVIEGNQKLAMRAIEVPEGTQGAKRDGDRWIKLKVLFETRGEGGYIVAPGSPLSVHPTGKPYRFIKGSAETIPTITPEDRALLLGLARALNEYHPKEEDKARTDGI